MRTRKLQFNDFIPDDQIRYNWSSFYLREIKLQTPRGSEIAKLNLRLLRPFRLREYIHFRNQCYQVFNHLLHARNGKYVVELVHIGKSHFPFPANDLLGAEAGDSPTVSEKLIVYDNHARQHARKSNLHAKTSHRFGPQLFFRPERRAVLRNNPAPA